VSDDVAGERRDQSSIIHELEVLGLLNAHERESLELELRHLAKRHGLHVRIDRAPMTR
jgi:hypothetical protein